MDVADWLRRLSLEQYEPAFRDNEIDENTLPSLTAEDLKDLGVAVVGHRRRLLDAIAALQVHDAASRAADAEAPCPAAKHTPLPDPSRARAERRQLTVVFVDLVGSTALAERMDPEDLREVIRSYHDACAGVVKRYEGFLAKYLGDGVLAYFGWPQTHEDEAERAVRAGLAITEALANLTAGGSLEARVGIATGLVVVGDLLGEGAAREEAVVGETPNLAARLQQLAAPRAVVIAEGTRRLLGGAFELEDIGAHRLHGFAEPVTAWRVLGEGWEGDRFDARRASGLTPLVGREHEIALLLDRWERAREGEGQVVLLAGEPGLGKSRIARTLRERIADAPHAFLRYQCSPHHTSSALHPIIGQLEHAAGFRRDDSAEAKLAKLETLLAQGAGDVPSILPPYAALLGIPIGGHYQFPPDPTPQQRKERTFDALLAQLAYLAGCRPVLLLFEDLHWADPTSLDLLGLMVDRVEDLCVLAVLTFRPEFAPPWKGRGHVTALDLNRLSRREAAALAERVSHGRALPPEISDQIVARADGVPLFVEELTRAVLESDLVEDAGDRYVLRGTLPPVAVPASLHDSLMARLDRLAPAKEVAQAASCIGRDFGHELLAAVAPLRGKDLETALERLVDSNLIVRRGAPPAASYSFRHALVQEAAYASLLKSRRQQLHAQIARTVEERLPELDAQQPEWVAHHYTEAGLVAPAVDRWLQAGERAKNTHANKEAVSHLRRCLDVIASQAIGVNGSSDLNPYKLLALVLLGDLTSLAGDVSEANRYYEQALNLSVDPDTRIQIENKRHRPRFAVRDGARIAFYEHGGGQDTLLFVAPLVYGLAAFQPIVERLCQEFRIVTVDSRGTGASDPLVRPYPLSENVKDVRAVIDMLGSGPLIGVGLSQGANLLFRLAHAEPELFEKLVMIGAPPQLGPPFFSEEGVRRRRELIEKGDFEGAVRLHTSLVFSEPETRELKEMFIQNRLKLSPETILSFFDPNPTVDVTPILADITVPTLVTHGREDQLVQFAAAEFLVARLPNARLYAFEGKGHLPLFTGTDEFCAVLRSFVRGGKGGLPRAL